MRGPVKRARLSFSLPVRVPTVVILFLTELLLKHLVSRPVLLPVSVTTAVHRVLARGIPLFLRRVTRSELAFVSEQILLRSIASPIPLYPFRVPL